MFQIMYETEDDEQFVAGRFDSALEAAQYLVTMLETGGLASEKLPGDFHWVQIEPIE